MNKGEICVGVDVGNSDTKTTNCTIPTGYEVTDRKPYMVTDKDYIMYGGKFYTAVGERFYFEKDKTKSDKMYVLTLFAIAKELALQLGGRGTGVTEPITVHLGIGLPPTHMGRYAKTYEEYYGEKSGGGIVNVGYDGSEISFKFGRVRAYPQGFAAIVAYEPGEDSVLRTYDTYRLIDVGGFTADKIAMQNGRPDVQRSFSLELGVNRFFEHVMPVVDRETGFTISYQSVEDVLRGRATDLDGWVKEIIGKEAERWAWDMVRQFRQGGEDFASYPTLFMGGGAMLFKEFLEGCPELGKIEFLSGTRRNAEAYRRLIQREVEGGGA